MGMWRSPHRKRKLSPPVSTRTSGFAKGTGIWLPMGKKGGAPFKPAGYGSPGKAFRDPQGKVHTIPDKSAGKAAKRPQSGR